METQDKIEAYFQQPGPFREGIGLLRHLMQATELEETLKWNAPVYCLGKTNVAGIRSFKHHFGIWFFNGALLSDPLGVLINAQEGKTKALRHWKFTQAGQIDTGSVSGYLREAIEIAREGRQVRPSSKVPTAFPKELALALQERLGLLEKFEAFTPYKQKEFAEYLTGAKRTGTRQRRLAHVLDLIARGEGLNDKYR